MKDSLKIMAISSLLFLAGCAGITDTKQAGSAEESTYRYEKTEEGCKLWITSGKQSSSADISIDADCALKANATAITPTQTQNQMLGIIDKLVPGK